jgi:hypothetical protein
MIKGVIVVDVACGEFMTDYDGVWRAVELEFWVYLNARGHSLALAWFGCLALILMIVGLDLLIQCMIPLKFPLLQFVYSPRNKIPYCTNEG